jgi:hypothetical protein
MQVYAANITTSDIYFDTDKVGIGNSSAQYDLDITGTIHSTENIYIDQNLLTKGFATNLITKTSNYTVDDTTHDHTILCDATSASFTITLLVSSTSTGKYISSKR